MPGKSVFEGREEKIIQVSRMIKDSKEIVALTGAGMSVESGIDPFRGKNGIWSKYDPEEYAYIDAFNENPSKIWVMLNELLGVIISAKPNPAHVGLAELEEMNFLRTIITQNVDGLHQEAGNKKVIEFHGNNQWLVCMGCNNKYKTSMELIEKIPPRCSCGAILRPDVVFFGEPIPREALIQASWEAENCDLMLVIGTSALVTPASQIPIAAKEKGATIVEINPETTPLTYQTSDITINERAGNVIPLIVDELKKTGH